MNFQHRVQTPQSLAEEAIRGVVLQRFFFSSLTSLLPGSSSEGRTASTMLRVDISSLDEGHHEQTLGPSASDLDLDPELFADIVVELRLHVMETRVVASFDVASVVTLECDRTLVNFQQPVRGEHAVVFVSPDQVGDESDDDSLLPLPEAGDYIDLTQAVRDSLLLSVPLRRVSPEAEDAEITTTYGEQQMLDGVPVDDRWDALRNLRFENPD